LRPRGPSRIALCLGFVALLPAITLPAESARQILDRGRALDETSRRWGDRVQSLEFAIHGRLGDRNRSLRLYERRLSIREHKVLVRILSPADVQELGFLEFTHSGGDSEQWLYLPEFKRVRRVTGSVRNERFVGSDLTHDDLDLVTALPGWTEEDADATLAGEETVDAVACHMIDLIPRRPDAAYKRIRLWLGKDDLFARRLELFADGAALTKRLSQSDVRFIAKIPVAHHIVVETPSDGTTTVITIEDTRFDVGIGDDCFSQATLEDMRREASACKVPPPS
jgi:outer membrane lipoprotein-sorting protein